MLFPQTPEVFFPAEVTQLYSHLIESHFHSKEQQLVVLSLHPILDTNVKKTLQPFSAEIKVQVPPAIVALL